MALQTRSHSRRLRACARPKKAAQSTFGLRVDPWQAMLPCRHSPWLGHDRQGTSQQGRWPMAAPARHVSFVAHGCSTPSPAAPSKASLPAALLPRLLPLPLSCTQAVPPPPPRSLSRPVADIAVCGHAHPHPPSYWFRTSSSCHSPTPSPTFATRPAPSTWFTTVGCCRTLCDTSTCCRGSAPHGPAIAPSERRQSSSYQHSQPKTLTCTPYLHARPLSIHATHGHPLLHVHHVLCSRRIMAAVPHMPSSPLLSRPRRRAHDAPCHAPHVICPISRQPPSRLRQSEMQSLGQDHHAVMCLPRTITIAMPMLMPNQDSCQTRSPSPKQPAHTHMPMPMPMTYVV